MVELRVASAYVTLSGSEILFGGIAQKVGWKSLEAMPKTLVTSFDFGLTEPEALRYWQHSDTKVFVSGAQRLSQGSLIPQRAFHPKIYMFRSANGGFNSLVGSANLTGRGLTVNTEAAWANLSVSAAEANQVFDAAQFGTSLLNTELLATYEAVRQRKPTPPGFDTEVRPVDEPRPSAEDLQPFRTALENGLIIPERFNAMWVQGDALQGGSHNQLELPRGAHRFFGFSFDGYERREHNTIGFPVLHS